MIGRRGSSRVAVRLAIFVLAVVVVGEVAAVVLRSPSSSGGQSVTVGAAASAESAPGAPTTTAAPSSTAPSTTAVAVAATTPTTTVVRAPGTITYTLTGSPSVTVAATSDSWIEVRTQMGAPIIWLGTLAAGQSKTYPAPVWIRTGNPAALTVTADGTPLAVPTTSGPIDVIVVPAA